MSATTTTRPTTDNRPAHHGSHTPWTRRVPPMPGGEGLPISDRERAIISDALSVLWENRGGTYHGELLYRYVGRGRERIPTAAEGRQIQRALSYAFAGQQHQEAVEVYHGIALAVQDGRLR